VLKLKDLQFSGIGRFVDPQQIYFYSLGHLVQVDGENRNTGGSSGSGKSTIFNALEYLLGLNDIPKNTLQSRLTKEAINVCATFDWDGKEVKIERAAKLKITIGDEVTTGSSEKTEAKLDEILAMPRDLFRKILHKRQKEGGFFLQFTPQKMNEFLIDCLGLSDLRGKLKILETKIAELTKLIDTIDSSLEANRTGLQASENARIAIGLPPVREIHKETVLALKEKMDASVANLQVAQDKHKLELEDLMLTRPKVVIKPYDRSAIDQLEKEKADLDSQLIAINKKESDRQLRISQELSALKLTKARLENTIAQGKVAAEQAMRMAKEVKKIKENTCPTCERDNWITETAKIKEQQLLDKIKELKLQIDASNSAAENIGAVNFSILELEKEMVTSHPQELHEIYKKIQAAIAAIESEKAKESERNKNEIEKNRVVLAEFAEKEKALRTRHAIELDAYRGQADIDRRTFEAAAMKLKTYENDRVRYEMALKGITEQETKYKEQVDELTKKFDSLTEELSLAEEAKRALKSYISCSFDDALAYISEVSTRIIRSIPNMANATIQLEGIRETKDGKVKEEVNAIVNMDGEVNIPIKSVSGGERSSIDLSIDLAVIDLIESRTGKGIDIFVLDEPFEGLDTICVEQVLEVLKNSSTNKKLLIVDHNPEVKQLVENRIVVVREGAVSHIAV
jgi:DNA repair exonuclease SbcCD ATPase subunit